MNDTQQKELMKKLSAIPNAGGDIGINEDLNWRYPETMERPAQAEQEVKTDDPKWYEVPAGYSPRMGGEVAFERSELVEVGAIKNPDKKDWRYQDSVDSVTGHSDTCKHCRKPYAKPRILKGMSSERLKFCGTECYKNYLFDDRHSVHQKMETLPTWEEVRYSGRAL